MVWGVGPLQLEREMRPSWVNKAESEEDREVGLVVAGMGWHGLGGDERHAWGGKAFSCPLLLPKSFHCLKFTNW